MGETPGGKLNGSARGTNVEKQRRSMESKHCVDTKSTIVLAQPTTVGIAALAYPCISHHLQWLIVHKVVCATTDCFSLSRSFS